jgi:integrase
MNFVKRTNAKGDKISFYYDLGRGKGQRLKTGVFIYAKPKNQTEKNHNKEALLVLETKRSQYILENQALGSGFMPAHKFKANFVDYYDEYVKLNQRKGNRHLAHSFIHFKKFVDNEFISPLDITENFCKRFRRYLLDHLSGETPGGYYARFKWVVNAAHKDGYFKINPTENVFAKCNPSKRLKENLEVDEYMKLLETPCLNAEIKSAFILCCYTGLRFVDVKKLEWKDIKGTILTTRIIQAKTGKPITLTLHPVAKEILETRKQTSNSNKVFYLPSANGANKVLSKWMDTAGIEKYITWSCARLSFSILLQDKNVDDATVAYLLGHTTTEQVRKTYKRHRPKDQSASISHLPAPESVPNFLNIAVI